PEPEPRVSGPHDTDETENASHPEERLEAVHRQDAVFAEVDRRGQHAQPRERLSEAPSAELAPEGNGQDEPRGSDGGGNRAQHHERSAEEKREFRVEADERRAIDISPVKMASEIEGIQLVAEVAVSVGGGQMHEELDRDEKDERTNGQRRQGPKLRPR